MKTSEDENQKMVWSKLWIIIIRSWGFKMKKQNFVLWPNNHLKLLLGVYFKF